MKNLKSLLSRRNKIAEYYGDTLRGVLFTSPVLTSYFTGITFSGYWLFLSSDKWYVLTPQLLYEQIRNTAGRQRGLFFKCTKDIIAGVAEIASRDNLRGVMLDFGCTTHSQARAIIEKLGPEIPVEDCTKVIREIRSVKDSVEAGFIRTAGRIADKVFTEWTRTFFRAGKTEHELAKELDTLILSYYCIPAFETIIASGPNSAYPHHVPGKRKIRENEPVILDFGVKYQGYCCDLTRTVFIGKLNKLFNKLYKVVDTAYNAGIESVRPSIPAKNVDTAVRQVVEHSGYGKRFIHGTGHGVGLEVHEAPTVSAKSADLLVKGNVITVEPGVYIPNRGGVRIENTVIITKTGCKRLT
ncbi:MAG: aminopeptidase P family protein [Elusimicrobiota bacterium]